MCVCVCVCLCDKLDSNLDFAVVILSQVTSNSLLQQAYVHVIVKFGPGFSWDSKMASH